MPGSEEHSRESDIRIRALQEQDLPAADQVMRVAFGTFLGMPEPRNFMGDAEYVRSRWRASPRSAFAAELDGELVGSNFATRWGSVGFFGPLTVRPDFWDRGVGKRLLEPIMACFAEWKITHAGLFTFAHSAKHVGLYQHFGFWPRFLTAIMAKPVKASPRTTAPGKTAALSWTTFSSSQAKQRQEQLRACRALTDQLYEGLDVCGEIEALAAQSLGDTVLLWDGDRLAGLAACHCGPGSEAGSGHCYLKFAAAAAGPRAAATFVQLLLACEALAAQRGLSSLVGGANLGRPEAYRLMREQGFATTMQGVAMQRPNEAGYNRAGVYLIDDWR